MPNASNIEYIAEDVADILSTPLTLELRLMARSSGWPSHIIADLEVSYSDGDLEVQYPEEISEEVGNLEYGDINSLPNAVIRPFILRSPHIVSKVIEQKALGALFVEAGVL